MKLRKCIPLLLACILSLNLISCAADSSSASTVFNASQNAKSEMSAAADYEFGVEMEEAWDEPDSESAKANDLSERKIIRTANLRYETTEYDKFLPSLSACIASYGGYLESSETYGGGIYSSYYSTRSASVTARIPTDRYDAFMAAAGDLGAVTYRSESQNDVTMSYVDTESHIRALETEYDTLLEILEKAESLEDVILLQSRISEVNYQLDSYKSQIRKYDDLISYCTVHINIDEVWRESTPNGKTLTFGERISVGLKENIRDIGEGFSDFTVWFVTSLPYLVIWAVIIVLIVLVIRLIVGKSKKKREQKVVEAYLRSQNDENQRKDKENS